MTDSQRGPVLQQLSTIGNILSSIAIVALSVLLGKNLIFGPATPGGSNKPRAFDPVNGSTRVGHAGKRHEGARVAIIEFSDFQCPFCGDYARTTYPQIQRDFVDKGVANYEFRHFPLESIHPQALTAAQSAECAGQQNRYWQMHDRLFANQKQMEMDGLLKSARALDLDLSRFQACMMTAPADAIRQDQEEAKRLGVRATPTFFIGKVGTDDIIALQRRMTGAPTYDLVKAAIADVLKAS